MQKSLYLNNIQLKAELDRCLGCATKPCKMACPIKCDPQYFIQKAKENNFNEASKSIYNSNPFGKICGLICPTHLCMKACIRAKIDYPIHIPKIQATIIEKSQFKNTIQTTNLDSNIHIAIIGCGPAGIGAAITLAKNGYKSTIFEKEQQIGGALNLIPENRLPKHIIKQELTPFIQLNTINIKTSTIIEKYDSLLNNGFTHVIVATGEDAPKNLNIKGEEFCVPYKTYLSDPHRYKNLNKIAIIGGGSVASDCALTAKTLGVNEVEMYIRRRLCDMRLSKVEYFNLIEAKINIHPLCSPIEIIANKKNFSLKFIRNTIKEDHAVPILDETSIHHDFDLIIKATGAQSSIQEYQNTLFYAGDCKNGSSSVVQALADGQNCALNLINTLLK